jgi:CBS-domain-containing membrane protein
MKARDVMVSPVVTVKPSATVRDVAKLFLERQISAVPVVSEQGQLVGIVSEGDLMHRAEIGTERRRSCGFCCLQRTRLLRPTTSRRTRERLKT